MPLNTLMAIRDDSTSRRSTPLNSYAVPQVKILESILPDNPLLVYQFAKFWCQSDPQAKTMALEKTLSLLKDSELGEQEKLKIRSSVYVERGETELAIETMAAILRGNPLEEEVRFQRAHLLFQAGRLQEALEEAQNLVRSNRMHRGYNQLLKHIESEIQKLENPQSQ